MVFYFDNSIHKKIVKTIQLIYSFSSAPKVEIVHGDWSKVEGKNDVVIFLIDHAAKGVDVSTVKLVEDGFKVFAFKKTKDSGFTFFSMSFTLLAAWRNILKKIEENPEPFAFNIHNNNQVPYSISVK